jgi:ribokinase
MVDEVTSENKILVTLGACNHITEENIEMARTHIESADIFLTQLETNIEAIEKAIDIAHKSGTLVVLNPAPVQPISDELLAKVDIITPNEIEAEILTGIKVDTEESRQQVAKYFMDRGIGTVVITLGKNGVYAKNSTTEVYVPSLKVEAVDTTGAGDAFNGGFVTALAEGKDLKEAVCFGNVVGALSVTKMGTAPSMPFRNEIDTYMENILCK